MAKRNVKEHSAKNAIRAERIEARLMREVVKMNKRYPESKYDVKDMNIVRISGRRPHKLSKKSDAFLKKSAEVIVNMIELEAKK